MVILDGEHLTIADIARVADGRATVRLSEQAAVRQRIRESAECIQQAVANGESIYGVTTLFGGMADWSVPPETASELQRNVIWNLKATTGTRLPAKDVRAAMLLRANSLARGVSGLRLEVLQRFETFLNAGVTPHVYELGSIGASGDLVPLAYIAGAILGIDPRYKVDFADETLDSHTALARLDLKPIAPLPKEGLALVNGTSVSTAVAANCVQRLRSLFDVALAAHALYIQALQGTNQSFQPFVHRHKPHPGQAWAAQAMLALLDGSRLVHDESGGRRAHRRGHLIQDRYSLRCLPQYLGPIVDGLAQIARQIEIEANSASDNPLIDAADRDIYHCGNFLAQYTAVAMDQLRYYVGLLAKHLDVQIALLVSPEFSGGLPPSLIGNPGRGLNVGFKSLQLVNNSIMPLIAFYGNSLADRYPTHAEQYNQNISSQSMGAAILARRSLDLLEHYLANALLFGVQAVALRTFAVARHYDARECLSPATARLYEEVYAVLGRTCTRERPLVWDDTDQFLDALAATVLEDIASGGRIAAVAGEALGKAARPTGTGA